MKRRAVFLDRDGVINRAVVCGGTPHPPGSALELEILGGVPESLAALKRQGFLLIVVTNQPDVARGIVGAGTVDRIHAQLRAQLPLDGILSCFHDDDACDCRKPKPGLLLRAAREYGIDLKSSFMVGDRWRDMEAGARAGCATLFIDHRYAERQPDACDHRVQSLAEAGAIILAQRKPAALRPPSGVKIGT
jgi:D-glycero-D-manno-heptose 1,7-bisphosphate phosphatase